MARYIKTFPERKGGEIPREISDYSSVSLLLSNGNRMPKTLIANTVGFYNAVDHTDFPDTLDASTVIINNPCLLMNPRILEYEVHYLRAPNARRLGSPLDPDEVKILQEKNLEDMLLYIDSPKWWIQDLARWRLSNGV